MLLSGSLSCLLLRWILFLTLHFNNKHDSDPDSNISKHFNLANHTEDDMLVLGLLFAQTDSAKRKSLEKRIIFKLGTLYPTRLNKQLKYLQ